MPPRKKKVTAAATKTRSKKAEEPQLSATATEEGTIAVAADIDFDAIDAEIEGLAPPKDGQSADTKNESAPARSPPKLPAKAPSQSLSPKQALSPVTSQPAPPVSSQAAPKVIHLDSGATSAPADEMAKIRARAARFGLPLTDTTKAQERVSRDGDKTAPAVPQARASKKLENPVQVPKPTVHVDDEEERKRKLRQQRFGTHSTS